MGKKVKQSIGFFLYGMQMHFFFSLLRSAEFHQIFMSLNTGLEKIRNSYSYLSTLPFMRQLEQSLAHVMNELTNQALPGLIDLTKQTW